MKTKLRAGCPRAATAALACALALGCMSPTAALAADADTDLEGSVSVTTGTAGDYVIYQLFTGSYRTDDDGTLQMGGAVVDPDCLPAILKALSEVGYPVTDDDGEDYLGLLDDDSDNVGPYSDRALANAILDQIYAISLADLEAAEGADEDEDYSSSDYQDYAGSTMRTFANALSWYLTDEDSGYAADAYGTATVSSSGGTAYFGSLPTGYYLVAQTSSADNEAQMSSMLFAVDGYDDDGEEGGESSAAKVAVPTADKTVSDDESYLPASITGDDSVVSVLDSSFGNAADSDAVGDDGDGDGVLTSSDDDEVALTSTTFRIVGTLADNVADFDEYYYAFHDELSAYYDLTATTSYNSAGAAWSSRTSSSDLSSNGTWEVYVTDGEESYDATSAFSAYVTLLDSDGQDATASLVGSGATSNDGGASVVTWECADLIAVLEAAGFDEADWSGCTVTVEYDIPMTSDEAKAYLAESSTLSVASVLTDYATVEYASNPVENNAVVEEHGTTGETVEDEAYLYTFNLDISKVDLDGEALTGAKFELSRLDDEGEKVVVGYQTVDDEDGSFTFTGLQADVVYTLTEAEVPSGYKSIDPVRFYITANLDSTGTYVESITVIELDDATGAAELSTSDATVTAVVTNLEGYDLPLTGAAGVAAGAVLGALLVAAGLALSRRGKAKTQEAAQQAQ